MKIDLRPSFAYRNGSASGSQWSVAENMTSESEVRALVWAKRKFVIVERWLHCMVFFRWSHSKTSQSGRPKVSLTSDLEKVHKLKYFYILLTPQTCWLFSGLHDIFIDFLCDLRHLERTIYYCNNNNKLHLGTTCCQNSTQDPFLICFISFIITHHTFNLSDRLIKCVSKRLLSGAYCEDVTCWKLQSS